LLAQGASRPRPRVRIWVPSMPCILSSWRLYPGPSQEANSTPNDEEPDYNGCASPPIVMRRA
jgi:hypothetical protein